MGWWCRRAGGTNIDEHEHRASIHRSVLDLTCLEGAGHRFPDRGLPGSGVRGLVRDRPFRDFMHHGRCSHVALGPQDDEAPDDDGGVLFSIEKSMCALLSIRGPCFFVGPGDDMGDEEAIMRVICSMAACFATLSSEVGVIPENEIYSDEASGGCVVECLTTSDLNNFAPVQGGWPISR